MSHLHARDQHHFEDVLGAGGGVSHGNVESPVDAEGHLPQIALWLLAVAIEWHVDVGEHAMEVETCFLACNTATTNVLNIRLTIYLELQMSNMFFMLAPYIVQYDAVIPP